MIFNQQPPTNNNANEEEKMLLLEEIERELLKANQSSESKQE